MPARHGDQANRNLCNTKHTNKQCAVIAAPDRALTAAVGEGL